MPSAPDAIVALVERFHHNLDYYHRPDYNETQVRREFIDPLF
ncbi:MAG: type IV restriction endonuclease, partial [Chloroflexi bacterium]|nr:type IV restriction endonuclease [Chloroflexota bacterium]